MNSQSSNLREKSTEERPTKDKARQYLNAAMFRFIDKKFDASKAIRSIKPVGFCTKSSAFTKCGSIETGNYRAKMTRIAGYQAVNGKAKPIIEKSLDGGFCNVHATEDRNGGSSKVLDQKLHTSVYVDTIVDDLVKHVLSLPEFDQALLMGIYCVNKTIADLARLRCKDNQLNFKSVYKKMNTISNAHIEYVRDFLSTKSAKIN